MKSLRLVLLIFFAVASGYANQWAPPSPRVSLSPSGELVLRILPSQAQVREKPTAFVFRISSDGQGYAKIREFALVNPVLPVEACISDEGDVFTFDDWESLGVEHVVVWYGADGAKKKEYSLEELFPERELSVLVERSRRNDSISVRWRDDFPNPYFAGSTLVISDTLEGHIWITDGTPEYIPKKEK